MLARQRAHVGKGRPQALARLPGEYLVAIDTMAIEQIERHIKLAPRSMARKVVQRPRDRVGSPGIQRHHFARRAAVPQNFSRNGKQCRLRPDAVDFQIGRCRHRLVIEIESPRFDQGNQPVRRQAIARQCLTQRRCHRMRGGLAHTQARQHLAPPLQADLARHRLARQIAHARNFYIEGIKREQRVAVLRRREQRGEITVPIGLAHQRGAVFVIRRHSVTLTQSTAIRPAPTRRVSDSRIL